MSKMTHSRPPAARPTPLPRVPATKRVRRALAAALLLAVAAGACSPTPTPPKASPSASSAAVAPKVDPSLPSDIAATVAALDGQLTQGWKQAGVTPSAQVDDAAYLRRLSLDLNGKLPTPEQVLAFTADSGIDKRAAMAKKLVSHPDYARRWADYFDQLFMRALPGKMQGVDRPAFRRWLHSELSSTRGWDELTRRLITAQGLNSEGGRPSPDAWELPDTPSDQGEVNGAVNWLLLGSKQPQNLAGATSKLFLGVQIQCAECHDHPTEKWKQTDFNNFTAAFMSTNAKRLDKGKVMGVRRFEVRDVKKRSRKLQRQMRKHKLGDAKPIALDGTPLDRASSGKAPLGTIVAEPDGPIASEGAVCCPQ